jgi:hypothetical protein
MQAYMQHHLNPEIVKINSKFQALHVSYNLFRDMIKSILSKLPRHRHVSGDSDVAVRLQFDRRSVHLPTLVSISRCPNLSILNLF